ncbi:MAG: site-specific integrase [Chloroflexota bacterium]|nr:site-specific integrase [Chloroflexota bacterium]
MDVAKPRIRKGTFDNYEKAIRLYICPKLGQVKLRELQPYHIRELERDIINKQKGATANHVHAVLRSALKNAVRENLIPRNPIDQMDAPRRPTPKVSYLTTEQVHSLLSHARQDRLYALYVLAITTGMRIGEILGLRWRDVDLDNAVITIQQQVTHTRGRMAITEPKTRSARRIITLPALAVNALREHKLKHPLFENLVFHTSNDTPYNRMNFYRSFWYPLRKRAGLPNVRFHDLRHSAATLLLSQGVHPKVVAERLGHSRVSTTLDIYSHVIPSLQRDVADKIDSLLAS